MLFSDLKYIEQLQYAILGNVLRDGFASGLLVVAATISISFFCGLWVGVQGSYTATYQAMKDFLKEK